MNEWTMGAASALSCLWYPCAFSTYQSFIYVPPSLWDHFLPCACARERTISGGLVGKAPLVVVHLSFTLLKSISTGQPELVTGYLLAAFCDRIVLPLNSHSYPVGKSDVSLIAAVWRPFVFLSIFREVLRCFSLRFTEEPKSEDRKSCQFRRSFCVSAFPLSLSTVGLSTRTLWFSLLFLPPLHHFPPRPHFYQIHQHFISSFSATSNLPFISGLSLELRLSEIYSRG